MCTLFENISLESFVIQGFKLEFFLQQEYFQIVFIFFSARVYLLYI